MTSATAFISGCELSRLYYVEAVRPILDQNFPGLAHSAALIGPGSEVLGFDDRTSTDHHWGPRLMLFLSDEDHPRRRDAIDQVLRNQLPYRFRGYPTNFASSDAPGDPSRLLREIDTGPVDHLVEILTIRGFFESYLGFDVACELEPADWLTFPQQRLRTITQGMIDHDDLGLERVRGRFHWYPRDLWLYLLTCAWKRIGAEEALMGRAGSVGDEVGSAVIASRLVRDLMRLCFLMERQYAPYPKWFGTAFRKLRCADDLWPQLHGATTAATWQERERHLVPAYEYVARMHNALNLTPPLPDKASTFHGRPFLVIHHDEGFADALFAAIVDPVVRRIADSTLIGSVEQFSDSTDLLCDPRRRSRLKALYM